MLYSVSSLSAGKMVMIQSLDVMSDAWAFLSSEVRLEGGAFALTRTADSLNHSCCASVSANLFKGSSMMMFSSKLCYGFS